MTDGTQKKRAPRKLPSATLSADDVQALFGQNLKIARLKRNMTLDELAAAASSTSQYLSKVENAQTHVTLRTAKRPSASRLPR